MAGSKNTKNKLNSTLLMIVKILHDNDIKNWFIGYGTLLGIVRENSCIDNDDDIDILCDINDYDCIKQILEKHKFTFCYKYGIDENRNILKTNPTKNYASVDFYMTNIDDEGNFNDTWEKAIWSNCYVNNELIKYEWNDTVLYMPNNYETKLINRYGNDWKIPKKTKGPKPRKPIL